MNIMNIMIRQVLRNLIHIRDVEMYCNISSDFKQKLKIFKQNKHLFEQFISSKDKDISVKFKYTNNTIISIFMYINNSTIYVRTYVDIDDKITIRILDLRADSISGKLIYFDCDTIYLNTVDKILNILHSKIPVEKNYTEEIVSCLDKLPTIDLESLKQVNMIYDKIEIKACGEI